MSSVHSFLYLFSSVGAPLQLHCEQASGQAGTG
uniref:Uncharacterized protein n=1 Tax=Anguilla anguilla TaxID=7936 RepID=A0A0E9UV25_ANGAN